MYVSKYYLQRNPLDRYNNINLVLNILIDDEFLNPKLITLINMTSKMDYHKLNLKGNLITTIKSRSYNWLSYRQTFHIQV